MWIHDSLTSLAWSDIPRPVDGLPPGRVLFKEIIMKAAYIAFITISDIFLLLFAALAPVYITPGYYWWTALALLFIVSNSVAFTKRMDKWQGGE